MKDSSTEELEDFLGKHFGIQILNAMGLSIVVVDKEFNIQWANTEYRNLQKTEKKIVGEKCYRVSFNSEAPCSEEICAVKKTLKTKKSAQGLKPFKKGKEKRFLDVYSFPLPSSQEEVEYGVEVIQDNTKLHRLVKFSNKLTAYASHQLKTPLATVHQIASVLKETDLPQEKRKTFYDRILSRAQHGLKTVENFLIFSRLQSGGIEITPTKTDFYSEIIEEVFSFHADYALENGVQFNCQIPENLQLTCDADYIRVVYDNLITNAIKQGGENRMIFLGYRDKGDDYHYFNVANPGEHISQKERENIFKRHITEEKGGPGVGLDVCQEIVEKHRGNIWVEPCYFREEQYISLQEARESKEGAILTECNNFIFTIKKRLPKKGEKES